MVVGFTTTCAISAYHHYSCEFESHSWRGVLETTLCDQVCQLLVAGRWFSPGTLVSSTNKTDHHNITEILLKVVLNTITIHSTSILATQHPSVICKKKCVVFMNNSSRFWLASWRQLEDVNYISFWLTRILFYTRYFHILFG
jgi:hypothetical protein